MRLDDDQLLDALRDSLTPSVSGPDPAELSTFRSLLASRFDGMATADDIAEVVPIEAARRTGHASSTGLRRVRHPVTALVAAAVLATGGVAAAGVATDTLPGPARQIAFAIGLPVSSPALQATRGAMSDLQSALDRQESVAIRTAADALSTDLVALSPSDRAQVEPAADQLLAKADAVLDGPSGSGTQATSETPSGTVRPPVGSAGIGSGTGPSSGTSSGQGGTGSSSGADTGSDGPSDSDTHSSGAGGDPSEGSSGSLSGSAGNPDDSGGGSNSAAGTTVTSGSGGSSRGSGSSGGGGSDGSGGSGGSGGPSGSGGSGSPGDAGDPGGSGPSGGNSGTSGNEGGSSDGGSALIGSG